MAMGIVAVGALTSPSGQMPADPDYRLQNGKYVQTTNPEGFLSAPNDNIIEGAGNYLQGGKGFNTFNDAKKALGSAGDGKAWHHIVEQNQIGKSASSAKDIHNTKNLVSVESGFSVSIHSQLSGHYSSIQQYTNGLTVRQWLSGQSYQQQFEYGLQQLSKYGTMTPTNTGWIFAPFK